MCSLRIRNRERISTVCFQNSFRQGGGQWAPWELLRWSPYVVLCWQRSGMLSMVITLLCSYIHTRIPPCLPVWYRKYINFIQQSLVENCLVLCWPSLKSEKNSLVDIKVSYLILSTVLGIGHKWLELLNDWEKLRPREVCDFFEDTTVSSVVITKTWPLFSESQVLALSIKSSVHRASAGSSHSVHSSLQPTFGKLPAATPAPKGWEWLFLYISV